MKKEKKVQFSEEAEIFSLRAGTMDFFIKDIEAEQKSSGDENKYKDYLTNARGMKENLLKISEKLKEL